MEHIWLNKGISRIAVAENLELDRSTITKVARTLIACDFIKTTGKYRGKPGAGRLATSLEINADFALILGIELQTEYIKTVLIDMAGTVRATAHLPFTGDTADLLPSLRTCILLARNEAAQFGIRIAGIGIGLSGIVDTYEGTIINSNPLGIHQPLALGPLLEKETGISVYIENDANCCCWGELAFRPADTDRNILALLGEFRNIDIGSNRMAGTAFGLGVAIRKTVFHGDSFTAGEFRSLLYDHKNPSHCQFSLTDDEARQLPGNRELLHRLFGELALNISLLVNCLDITQIIIAGDYARYCPEIGEQLEAHIQKNWIYQNKKKCRILPSPDAENAVCMGAAGLFLRKLFTVPGMTDHTDEEVGSILLDRVFTSLGILAETDDAAI